MSFRDMFADDLKTVFHNSDEFAREYEIGYDGNYYTVSAVFTEAAYHDREESGGRSYDYRPGIYSVYRKLYVQRAELDFIPSINAQMEVDGDLYDIVECSDLESEIVVTLRRYDH